MELIKYGIFAKSEKKGGLPSFFLIFLNYLTLSFADKFNFSIFALPKVGGEFKTLKMYAIVDIAGQQFKVRKEQKIFVHRLEAEQGQKVEFNKVLLIDNDGKVVVGAPVIEGATVTAEVVSHLKGDKVKVFKKKRRKGYKKLNGHRQYLSEIVIEDILEKGKKAKAKAKAEPETAEKEEVKAEAAPKTVEKKEEKAEAKPKTAKKTDGAKPKATAAKSKTAAAKPKAAKKVEAKKEEPVDEKKQEDKKED